MEGLKPCPFCGATPRIKRKKLVTEDVFSIDQIHYDDCFLLGFKEPDNKGYITEEAAIKAWNRRVNE